MGLKTMTVSFKRSWKLRISIVLAVSVCGILYFGFYCQNSNCGLRKSSSPTYKSNYEAYFAGRFLQNKFSKNQLNKDYDLDLENEDVIVFLHIQKTGGTTFGKHLVENLDVDPPCNCYKRVKKHCDCLTRRKQVWLFSRYSTGWPCGLHADWTELKTCVDEWFQTHNGTKKRRYHYITLLRDPVSRFISEWLHVQRGATWKTAGLKCNGREATLAEVPFCYAEETWEGVSLRDFMACRHNLAFNRQTRMLANLSKVNCYNTSAISQAERDRIMLDSAKFNLVRMAFFGLVEFQTYTQFLFEHTLNINFIEDLVQHNQTHSGRSGLSAEKLKEIAELNHLDIELYQFAKDLFLQRVKQAFVDEDIPVPKELDHLSSSQAVEGGRGQNEPVRGSMEEITPLSKSEGLDVENGDDSSARDIVGDVGFDNSLRKPVKLVPRLVEERDSVFHHEER